MAGFGDMFGSLVSAGSSLVGGYLDNQYNKKAAQTAFQNSFDAQKYFAENSIQMKVRDAKAAGISPEFAMGAGTVSAPTESAFSSSLGKAMGDAGQELGRAIKANMSDAEKEDVNLKLERGHLENELLKSQIARARQEEGPSVPKPDGPKPAPAPEFQGMRVGPLGKTSHAYSVSDANDVQNRYGDIAEDLWGLGVALPADLFKTFRDRVYRPWAQRNRAEYRRWRQSKGDTYGPSR